MKPCIIIPMSSVCYTFVAIIYLQLNISPSIASLGAQPSSDDTALYNGVEGEQRLLRRLKRRLPSMWPPVDLVNRTVFVYIDLFKIQEIQEKHGMWIGKFFTYYYYYSPSAKWNKSEYNNDTVKTFIAPKGTFWMPDLIVHEASELKYEAFDRQVVFESGMVLAYTSLMSYQMNCMFDVSQFPFDSQQCVATLTTHVSQPYDYQLATEDKFYPKDKSGKSYLPLLYFIPCDQWQLEIPVEIEVDRLKGKLENQFRPVVKLTINLQRRPLFYKLVLVYPSVILYLLSAVTYFIPPNSGEKVSFAVTILLTEVVSYGTLVDILPASSHHVPHLIYFLTAVTFHLTWTCVTTVTVVNIQHKSPLFEMYKWVEDILASKYISLLGLQLFPVKKKSWITTNQSKGIKLANINPSEPINGIYTADNYHQNEPTAVNEKKQDENEESALKWVYLATFLDRLFFILHIVVIAINLSMFSYFMEPY